MGTPKTVREQRIGLICEAAWCYIRKLHADCRYWLRRARALEPFDARCTPFRTSEPTHELKFIVDCELHSDDAIESQVSKDLDRMQTIMETVANAQ